MMLQLPAFYDIVNILQKSYRPVGNKSCVTVMVYIQDHITCTTNWQQILMRTICATAWQSRSYYSICL